jgi:hypothetical protein
MSVADMTGKGWVEKTHIHMAERRFGILGCRNALRRITTGGEFQTIPGRREKALYGMRNGGFEVVGLVTLSLASCLYQCDLITIWVWNRRTDYRQPKEENGVSRDPERSRKARLKIELPYCHYLEPFFSP